MTRRHGWAGDPPANEKAARERIVTMAMRCLDTTGPTGFTISDVAAELGVTRPTVYRYFPSTDDLFVAVALRANDAFIDALTARLVGIEDPAAWVVEGIVAAAEIAPRSPHLTIMLAAGRPEAFARGFTSEFSRQTGRELLKRSSINWTEAGFSETEQEELIEHMLRTLQSLLVDPPHPPRDAAELRRYLHRWVAPSVQPRINVHREVLTS